VSYTSSQTRKTLSYFILSSQKKKPFPWKTAALKKAFQHLSRFNRCKNTELADHVVRWALGNSE